MKRTVNKDGVLAPRFRVIHKGETALGPGKVELLGHIAQTGSIGEAAESMGMSYMRAWKLINTMNRSFKEPLVMAQRGGPTGGGVKLTTLGKRVLKLYGQAERETAKATRDTWLELKALLKS